MFVSTMRARCMAESSLIVGKLNHALEVRMLTAVQERSIRANVYVDVMESNWETQLASHNIYAA